MQYILGLGDSTTLPESGVNVEQIARNLKASPDSLMPHIEDLVSEGHLYTTLDEAQCVPLLVCRLWIKFSWLTLTLFSVLPTGA